MQRRLNAPSANPQRRILFCLVSILALAGTGTFAAPFGPQRSNAALRSIPVNTPPEIDGLAGDPAWRDAPEIETLAVEAEGYPEWKSTAVKLSSVHTDRDIYFLISWPDETPDELIKPPGAVLGREETDELDDDGLALSFGIRGEFVPDMFAPVEATWDVWAWRAGSANLPARAADMTHRYGPARFSDRAKRFLRDDGKELWIERRADAGAPGTTLERGAEISAKGMWKDGRWTVEIGRKLKTADPDNAVFAAGSSVSMALAVFHRTKLIGHRTTGLIALNVDDSAIDPAGNPSDGVPVWLVGSWELSDPMGAAGSNPTFSVFPDGRVLLFNPDGNHAETQFENGAMEMEGMLAKPLSYNESTLVLLYFNYEDEVFGNATVWSKVANEPKDNHSYEKTPGK